MIILPLLLQATDTPQCVYPDTALNRRHIEAGTKPSCEPQPEPEIREVSTREQRMVREYFDLVLYDGPSARWRFMHVRGEIVCGLVNAKNQYGGYVGWQPFLYSLSNQTGDIYPEERLWYYNALCLGETPDQRR